MESINWNHFLSGTSQDELKSSLSDRAILRSFQQFFNDQVVTNPEQWIKNHPLAAGRVMSVAPRHKGLISRVRNLACCGLGFGRVDVKELHDVCQSQPALLCLSLSALVETGEGYAEAIAAAQKGMQSENWFVRNCALDLFKVLVEKGEGYDEAKAAAKEGVKSENLSVRNSALKLFKALFEKGEGYAEAKAAAKEGVKSEDLGVRSSALGLFEALSERLEALLEKGEGYDEAKAAAKEWMKSEKVRNSALKLFRALFEKGQGYDEAVAAVKVAIAHPDSAFVEDGYRLYCLFAKVGFPFSLPFERKVPILKLCVKDGNYSALKKLAEGLSEEELMIVLGDSDIGPRILVELPGFYDQLEKKIAQFIKTLSDGEALAYLPFVDPNRVVQVATGAFAGRGEPEVTFEDLTTSLSEVLVRIESNSASQEEVFYTNELAKITFLDMARGVINSKDIERLLVNKLQLLPPMHMRSIIPLVDPKILIPHMLQIPLMEWPQFVLFMSDDQKAALFSEKIPIKSLSQKNPHAKRSLLDGEIMALERLKKYDARIEAKITELQKERTGLHKETALPSTEEDIPEEYLDPITTEVMSDPVMLPDGKVVDRSTVISSGWRNPFTRAEIEERDLTPLPELKKQIEKLGL